MAVGGVTAVAAGCGNGATTGTTSGGGTPQKAPSRVASIRISIPQVISATDPLLARVRSDIQVLHLVGGTLFAYVPGSTKVVPALAESATTSADGKTVTIPIRSGLTFSDGSKLTADDVVASFQRALDDKGTASGEVFGSIASVRRQGAADVVLKLRQPRADLQQQLATAASTIIPARAVKDKKFFDEPVFAGPYKFDGAIKANTVTLVRNPSYAGPKPVADKLVLSVVRDPYAELTQLQGGQLDFVTDVPPDRFKALGGGVTKAQVATANAIALTFNNKKAPVDDARVRKAIGMAVNRTQLAQIGFSGNAQPATGPFPPAYSRAGAQDFPAAADLARARQLLAGTACASGCSLKINTFASATNTGQMATAIQQMLKPLGIKVTAEPLDDNTLVQRNFSGNFQGMVVEFGGQSFASQLKSELDPDGGLFAAFSYWSTPAAGRQVDAVLGAGDDAAQSAALNELNATYMADTPWVPLTSYPSLTAASKTAAGAVQISPTDFIDVATR